MQRVFGPAIRMINDLSYAAKLVIVACVFVVPIGAALYVIASTYSEQITVAETELEGAAYTKPLIGILRQVQAHRGMMALLLNKREIDPAKIAAARNEIDVLERSLDALFSAQRGFKPPVDDWKKWQGEWQTLRQQAEQLTPAESFKRHTSLAEGVTRIIDNISNASGLALDPDLDSYYVMIALQTQVPALAEQMGQARALGATALADGSVEANEKIGLQVRKARIDDLHGHLQGFLQIATGANASISKALVEPLEAYSKASQFYHQLITQNFLDSGREVTPATTYFATATRAIDALYALGDVLESDLRQLLQQRIDKIGGKRTLAILSCPE